MSNSWNTTTIKDACEQMNGIWKGAKPPFTTAKILRTTNFSKDCKMKLDDLAIIEVEEKKMNARRLKRGDIIVEKSGGGPKQPVGRVILFDIDDEDFSFCNFTSALRVKNQSEILPEYLHKYLTFFYFEGETEKYQSNLVGFRNLDFKGYVSMSFRYPELSEQQRIVSLLDAEFAKIDTLKANAERNMQNAKDLFQAALKKELEPKEGWEKKPLKEITSEIGDGLHGTPIYSENGSYFFVNGNNLEDGIIEIKANTKKVNQDEFQKYKLNLNETTVLLSINGTVGKTAFYNGEPIILGKSACYINVIPSTITKEYIRYFLLSDSFRNYARDYSRQATIINLGLKEIRNMTIPYPQSLTDQQSIVFRLDEINTKCKTLQANYEKTIALCDDLKQALLRKAFNGEI